MKYIITLALVICAVGMPARAQSYSPETGNTLYESCGAGGKSRLLMFCLGYLSGFRDGILLGHGRIAKNICIPPKTTNGQMKDVVLRALRESPNTRHDGAWELFAHALYKAWPCK